MNKIYKVVWSKVKHCYVVTSELAKRQTKGCGARSLRTAAVTMGVAAALLGAGHPLFGMPVAEAKTTTVQHGNKIVNTTVDYTTVFNFQYPEKSITVGETEIYEVSNAYGVFGNVAQRSGGIKTKDNVHFKVVDGQLMEVHDVTLFYLEPYQRVLAVHPFNYSKGTDAEIDDEIKNSDGAKADVSGYTVTMTGGSLQELTGGLSYSGNVSNNTVNLDGGTAYKVYGGYTVGGAAEKNHVVLNGGIAGVSGTIVSGGELYGAYSYNDSGASGNVTGNTVTVDKSGIVMAPVYGGNTKAEGTGNKSGDAIKNIVTINGGTLSGNIYGGYSDAQYKTSGNVEGNQVIIKSGVLKSAPVTINGTNYNTVGVGNICGGYTYGYDNASGIAKDNEVTISGGTLRDDVRVIGGHSNGNHAEHNTVTITKAYTGTVGTVIGGEAQLAATKNEVAINGGTAKGNVLGALSYAGMAGGDSAAAGNKAAVDSVVVEGNLIGGWSYTGASNYNTVTVKGSTSKIGDATNNNVAPVIGGLSGYFGASISSDAPNSGDAKNNTVTIENGNIDGSIYGGASITHTSKTSGDVTGNKVQINGGKVLSSVYGGYNHSGSADKTASNNEVTMDGGYADEVYGGWSLLGKAAQNTVTLNSGAEAGKVYGGWGGATAEKNEVIINGGTVGGVVFGGGGAITYNSTATGVETATGNTVTVKDGTVKNVTGGSGIDSAENNTVIIEKGKVSSTIAGGYSATGNIKNNTVTIKGGTIGNLVYAAQYAKGSEGTITDNVINLTGNVTLGTYVHLRGYECRSSYEVPNHSGNDLHVGGIKGGAAGVWQGRNSEGTVTNTVVSVANFDTIVYHSVKWDENVAALAATTVENIGAIDIKNLTFDPTSATGTMSLLKATGDGADLSTIKLNYSGGTGVAITTDGVEIGGGAPTPDDGVNGVKLTSTSSDKVLLASDKKAINYSKGATTVSAITFGEFDIVAANAARDLTGSSFATGNTVDAGGLTFKDTTKALKKNNSITLVSKATGITTTVDNGTGKKIGINYTDDQKIAFTAKATGDVTSAGGSVKYTVGSVAVNNIDVTKWDGTPSTVTASWDTKNAEVKTSGISVTGMNPGDTKTILTAASGSDFSSVTLDAGAWQKGGDITDKAVNGVEIAGKTTGGGVKVSDDKTQLVYQQDKKNVTGITLGAFDASKAARSFGSGDDLRSATINAGGFSISNLDATKSSVVVLDATNAIANNKGETLQGDTLLKTMDPVEFSDPIDGTVLTFAGKHTDTLEQNAKKTQIVYKVGDKNVNDVKFDGEVAWDDSKAYYENKADANGKFAYTFNGATNVDADKLTVTGTSTSALKKGASMTLLSVKGMEAKITAPPADAGGVDFSYTEKGVAFTGKAVGEVKATTNAVNYEVTGIGMNTVDIGTVNWAKDTTLVDYSDESYDFTNVKEIGAKNFAMTFTDPTAVAANDSMTLLKANETLTAMVAEEKAKIEKTYDVTPVSGVDVNATLKGKVTTADGQVKVTAESNQANTISFGKVEWTGDTPLLDHNTTLKNVSFNGATVDTSNIDFYKEMYIEADQTTTLVSNFGEEAKITPESTKYMVGTAFEGESETKLEGRNLILRTKTAAGVSEQTHKAVMAVDANMALLATGNEYVGQVLAGLGDPANVAPDGTTVGAAIGGGWNRYDTGSHVNVNSWNAAVGIGAKRDLKNGSLEYGVFGEYGKGNYKLHSEVGSSDGDAHYAGGGLLAKWTNKHDVYTEASFRFGRMSDSANDLLRDGAGNAYGYDVHANYFGAHAGIGKIFRYKGGKSLDVYGKYFYTKRDGVEFDAKQHYNLDSVKSSLLRIGARYGTTDKKWNWYGGLAYEYEFDGEATGTVKDTAIRAASIKGSSVRAEFGMRMNATKTNPWQTDISLYGYGGKHRGFGGNVNVAYMF
ncbi:MAG: ESPR-type extended signal peptide-containing protein [Succiniclasticum sp.]|uniref:ESPR-type extended signal peptide-containing protein n=1 Tax=Succiniclasticum sp. TaxID=2775030 RepID=UPI002A916E40|nr:ESPR-type extended signal peptide-containing protein [Succiniclasticum sp.]MDY6291910.1 ESPR-type extended signal peptide-containing protein [Succiniclasticum sp.]